MIIPQFTFCIELLHNHFSVHWSFLQPHPHPPPPPWPPVSYTILYSMVSWHWLVEDRKITWIDSPKTSYRVHCTRRLLLPAWKVIQCLTVEHRYFFLLYLYWGSLICSRSLSIRQTMIGRPVRDAATAAGEPDCIDWMRWKGTVFWRFVTKGSYKNNQSSSPLGLDRQNVHQTTKRSRKIGKQLAQRRNLGNI